MHALDVIGKAPKAQAGAKDWSFGFETTIASFTFIDLKPDTEYEVQVRSRNAAGEGPPTSVNIRTDPAGDAGNAIPFPLH
ncbi:MAG: fibronectin type III domain-containing protein [Chloroflexi bacterium]|nr:fibronectin type III domain-containing protein [Chloroflexota bacterium]